MNDEYIVPSVGSYGKFSLNTPFDTILNSDQEYKVIAVRTIPEMQTTLDVFTLVYEPVSLQQSDFDDDLNKSVPIVTLESNSNKQINIPADRILSLPTIVGVKYQGKALVLNLGSIPKDTNLDVLKNKIKDVTYENFGLYPGISESNTSAITIVTNDNHDIYVAKLLNNKSVFKSNLTLIGEKDTTIAKQQAYINELEEWIIKKQNEEEATP